MDIGSESFTKEHYTRSPWLNLCTNTSARKLREQFCTFRISAPNRSHVQSEAEIIVHDIKKYLVKNNNFKLASMDIFDFTFALDKISLFLNSRPLFANKDIVISSMDLVTAAGRGSPALPYTGLLAASASENQDAEKFKNIIQDIKSLENMKHHLHQNLAFHFLDRTKQKDQHTSNIHRNGPSIETLKVGDIVVDRKVVLDTGSCSGSFCRIALLSKGKRVALLLKVKPSLLNNPDYLNYAYGLSCLNDHNQPCIICPQPTFQRDPNCLTEHIQPCMACIKLEGVGNHLEIVSRETQDLFFITSGNTEKDEETNVNNIPITKNLISGPMIPTTDFKYNLTNPKSLPKSGYSTMVPPLQPNITAHFNENNSEIWDNLLSKRNLTTKSKIVKTTEIPKDNLSHNTEEIIPGIIITKTGRISKPNKKYQ
jgi:hypothetical protein